MSDNTKIQQLNDAFRTSLRGGKVVITQGVEALPDSQQREIFGKIRVYDNFTEDNDPYGEHDFGSLEIDNHKIFWKIDYYAKDDFARGSENSADPEQTTRLLTVMLASEY